MSINQEQCLATIQSFIEDYTWPDEAIECVKSFTVSRDIESSILNLLQKSLLHDLSFKHDTYLSYRHATNFQSEVVHTLDALLREKVSDLVTEALLHERLDKNRHFDFEPAPQYVSVLLEVASNYGEKSPNIQEGIRQFLKSCEIIFSDSTTGLKLWEGVMITAVTLLGKWQCEVAVPELTSLLHVYWLQDGVHTAIIDSLARMNADAAIISICSVYPAREIRGTDSVGYSDRKHDYVCRLATSAVFMIGTPLAFRIFLNSAQKAFDLYPYNREWMHEVRKILESQTNSAIKEIFVNELRYQPLSEQLRQRLLAALPS